MKIATLTVVLGLVGICLGVVALVKLRSAAESARDLNEQNVASLAAAAKLRGDFRTYRIKVLTAGLAKPGPDQEAEWEDVEASWADVQEAVDQMTPLVAGDPERQALLTQVTDSYLAFRQFTADVLRPLAERANIVGLDQAFDGEGEQIVAPAVEGIDALYALERESASQHAQEAADAGTQAMIQILVLMVIGTALAVFVGWQVTRSITRPVSRVGYVVQALAHGDLTQETGVAQDDEIGQMARSLDSALFTLRETMGQVVASANTLASASAELSASTSALTETAGVVSGNVQTVAAGSEEMGASIGEIASSASRAVAIADDAVRAAGRANDMVARLSRSSAEIGSVIGTIANLADETNTLALNATIEAARAGDSGRGFAVVAGEVKSLAHQTTAATGDIEQRVRAIQADAEAAVASIGEISTVIQAISTHQSTIAAAVEEQTAVTAEMARNVHDAAGGVSGIVGGVDPLSGVHNGGLAELEAVTEDLAKMSTDLKDLTGRFRY